MRPDRYHLTRRARTRIFRALATQSNRYIHLSCFGKCRHIEENVDPWLFSLLVITQSSRFDPYLFNVVIAVVGRWSGAHSTKVHILNLRTLRHIYIYIFVTNASSIRVRVCPIDGILSHLPSPRMRVRHKKITKKNASPSWTRKKKTFFSRFYHGQIQNKRTNEHINVKPCTASWIDYLNTARGHTQAGFLNGYIKIPLPAPPPSSARRHRALEAALSLRRGICSAGGGCICQMTSNIRSLDIIKASRLLAASCDCGAFGPPRPRKSIAQVETPVLMQKSVWEQR